jgi:hypothetical protein
MSTKQGSLFLIFTLHVQAYSNQSDIMEVSGKATGNGRYLTSKKRGSTRYILEYVQFLGLSAHFAEPKMVLAYAIRKKYILSSNFKTLQFSYLRNTIQNVGSSPILD